MEGVFLSFMRIYAYLSVTVKDVNRGKYDMTSFYCSSFSLNAENNATKFALSFILCFQWCGGDRKAKMLNLISDNR